MREAMMGFKERLLSNLKSIPQVAFSAPDKENIPADVPRFRRPDPDSPSLFDPDLLAAFRQAVADHRRLHKSKQEQEEQEQEQEQAQEQEEEEETGPPRKVRRRQSDGDEVVLYTTSIGGIRKSFEDCNRVRALLRGLRVRFDERDLAMHRAYADEMRRVAGGPKAVPPRLVVKGRLVGGADEVLALHERGALRQLLRGVAADRGGEACRGCGGVGFVVCGKCSGSRKVFDGKPGRCDECNENGLLVCGLCRSRARSALPPTIR